MRKNSKRLLIDKEQTIVKSNEFSMAQLSSNLTLNQTQLLATAILFTQKEKQTFFRKSDFEKIFGLKKYNTKIAERDADALYELDFKRTFDEKKDSFHKQRVFQDIHYDKGTFSFVWTDAMVPHIIGIKEKYILNDLTITSQFKSSYSWVLYEFLKANYGNWHKTIDKESALNLFGVSDKASYVKNTGKFKQAIIEVAIAEINELTELEVSYEDVKEGRSITGFKFKWSVGEVETVATSLQIEEIRNIYSELLKQIQETKNQYQIPRLDMELNMLLDDIPDVAALLEDKANLTQQLAHRLYQNLRMHLTFVRNITDKYITSDFIREPEPEVKHNKIFYDWLNERE